MKTIKQLILLSLFMFGGLAYAQVGIGTNSPNHALEIESSDSGLVIPRVANTAAVTVTPVNGTMIYDNSANCVKAYENGAWSDCLSAGGGGSTVTVRSTAVGTLVAGDLNNVVVATAGVTFDLADVTPSEGDTITVSDATGTGVPSLSSSGPALVGQSNLLAPGGALTAIYDADTNQWYMMSAF